jgi:hypothetical protein
MICRTCPHDIEDHNHAIYEECCMIENCDCPIFQERQPALDHATPPSWVKQQSAFSFFARLVLVIGFASLLVLCGALLAQFVVSLLI